MGSHNRGAVHRPRSARWLRRLGCPNVRLLSGALHCHRPAGQLEDKLPVGVLTPVVGTLDGVGELVGVQFGVAAWTTLRRYRHAQRIVPRGSRATDRRSTQNVTVARVIRVGPLPLLQRRSGRVAELERIFSETVELVEVTSVAELEGALVGARADAVVLDAPGPGALADAVEVSGSVPILRPIWTQRRSSRGETDEVFDGYGRLIGSEVVPLGDGGLSR